MVKSVLVCLPTYNRAAFLPQAIESVLAQTYANWHLLVVDDGSIDDTEAVVARYQSDSRITYLRNAGGNMGGVFANECGMNTAINLGFDAWTRLGSDDWFLPEKLRLDVMALEHAGACFGPYQNEPPSYDGELNGPSDARAALLRGEFAASWANIAMRVEVLRKVKERHGNFVDPRLRNMEDYLFNVRAARFTEFAWRGELLDGRVVIGPRSVGEGFHAALADSIDRDLGFQEGFKWKSDARYRIGADIVCCSNSPEGRAWGAKDAVMTEIVRGEDASKGYPIDEVAPVPLRVIVP